MKEIINEITNQFAGEKFTTLYYSGKWARVYDKGHGCYAALLSFSPSAYPLFVTEMEANGTLKRLANYSEVSMGVVYFHSCQPYELVKKALKQTCGEALPTIHQGTKR